MGALHTARRKLAGSFSGTTLSVLIVLVALVLIYLAVTVESPWAKAGILLYEVLP